MTTIEGFPLVPRAVRWAAHAAPLTLLPSGLWRCAIAFGMPSGFGASDPMHRSKVTVAYYRRRRKAG
ncbi:hypothetical protein ACWGJW_25150 [Streptomyces nigrescens]